jgi:hypothetical protein
VRAAVVANQGRQQVDDTVERHPTRIHYEDILAWPGCRRPEEVSCESLAGPVDLNTAGRGLFERQVLDPADDHVEHRPELHKLPPRDNSLEPGERVESRMGIREPSEACLEITPQALADVR